MTRDVAGAWERFGRDDPYFGVLNAPRFHAASEPGPIRDEFFASGETHVDALFATIRSELVPGFEPHRALDFGCGVGRVLLPIAHRAHEVLGVDISPSMLAEARRNCGDGGVRNVTLATPDRLEREAPTFDFIHSYIVFQHIPQKAGLRNMRRLLELLAPDGVGALHLVYESRLPRWQRFVHWVRKHAPLAHVGMNVLQGRALASPLMQMNPYDLNAVFALLQEHDCHRVTVRFSDHGGWLGVLLVFQRRAQLDRRVS
ncbi:MAG TPA: class I SAM-dependent methyltransferase [Steroidobacteraceae bacterium]|nr:class I SAM-dependent methyltransferase [Steroidobacteraceae bacterium]